MPTTYLAGLLTGLSLIVAIGAQNAFVLRQGILRRHVLPVVAICVLADASLIALGTAGAGAIVRSHPDVLAVLRWVGAAYLLWFGLSTLWQARRPEGLTAAATTSGRSVVLTALALTFLNPHVYLDTVVMLGIISTSFDGLRWVFAAGAMTGSLLWFPALAWLGGRLAPWLARPRVWQVLGVVIGLVMITLAAALAFAPTTP
jgi:L-lysine exporter family protein LysE/ArgO